MSYKAFISYSHATDGQLAPAIQSALHGFAKPFYRLRSVRVFRDETSLHLTPELWPRIQQGLNDSEYFILMASPQAAASKWVQNEVDAWLASRDSLDKFLVVLTAGEIKWNEEAADFDWQATTALPTNLKSKFKGEPLYSDFRWARDIPPAQLSLRNPKFLREIGRLASTLHQRSLNDMIGEDVRQHRVFKFVASVVGILLMALSIGASGAAYYANQRRAEAISERNRAEESTRREREARKAEEEQRANAIFEQEGAELAAVRERTARLVAVQQRQRAEEQTRLATNMKTVGELYREASNIEARGFPNSYFEEYQGGRIPGLLERILAKYRETKDVTGQISTLIALGDKPGSTSGDRTNTAVKRYEEAVSLSHHRDPASEVAALIRLGETLGAGDAEDYYRRAVGVYGKEPSKEAEVLVEIARRLAKKTNSTTDLNQKVRNQERVHYYFTKAAEAYHQIGDSWGEGLSYSDLGHHYFYQFNSERGAYYFNLSIPLLEKALPGLQGKENRAKLARTFEIIATMSSIVQSREKAIQAYRSALEIYRALGNNNKIKEVRDAIDRLEKRN